MKSLRQFSNDLKRLPKVVALRVAAESAPAITALARETFEASETPEGKAWAPGSKGQRVTLVKTGALFKYIHYVAAGTKLRVALGVPYAKYQVGKRPVFPRQDSPLPEQYQRVLQRVAVRVVKEELARQS